MIWKKASKLSLLLSILRILMIKPCPIFVVSVKQSALPCGLMSDGKPVQVSLGIIPTLFKSWSQDINWQEA